MYETSELRVRQPTLEVDAIPRKGNWMQTASGKKFWPLDPRPEDIDIHDVAHSLSNLCRYAGHCKFFYSVAEHSVLVAEHLMAQGHDVQTCLTGLLHDATEAYCTDVPRPLKPFLLGYDAIEAGLWLAVAQHFNLPPEMPKAVHVADDAVLLAEKPVLMGTQFKWVVQGVPAKVDIHGYAPRVAEQHFLQQYRKLTGAPL